MSDQLRSELLKLRTIRMTAVFLLLAVGLALLTVLADGLSATLDELAAEDEQRRLIGTAATNGGDLRWALGRDERVPLRNDPPDALFEPRRRVVLAAKLAAGALVGIFLAVACVAVSFGAGLALLSARDVEIALTWTNTLVLVFGTIAASALAAMLGVSLGALIRNQVGAITALAVYSLVVDVLLFTTVPSVGRFLPGEAANSLSDFRKRTSSSQVSARR